MNERHEDEFETAIFYLGSIRRLLFGLTIIVLLTTAYFARGIILPVMLGVLMALLLSPLVRGMKRVGFSAPIAAMLIVFVVTSLTVAGALALKQPVTDLLANAPQIALDVKIKGREVIEKIAEVREMGENIADMASGDGASDAPAPVADERIDILAMVTNQMVTIASTFGGAMLLALFILASDDLVQRRIVEVMPRFSDKRRALAVARDVEHQISRYLASITLINMLLGFSVGVACWYLGLPMPAVWGVAAALLNYLPFVGPIIGMIGVGMVALVSFDTVGEAFLPPFSYFVLNAIEANFVTPLFVGKRLELNTIAVFLMVMFWIWLWGFAGAFLAVPFLVVVRVLCANIEEWHNFGRFLASRDG
ncbi:AI-2E family transporter [Marivivens donghaensis]|uniref:AI-2E family transporter n=1 Tax=Marivivens donghaensis TaxID=1699413 RepID=A0ABX0VVL6_9RHOB|nr:AI-2E family transporter [Marivivens donghaensis]NIY71854.1 AI-2E family transporter [Marivivens donghaensis]